MESIETKFKKLPDYLKEEVEDFIDFLIIKKRISKQKKLPKLDWIGGLKEYRNQYKAVDLQKKASEWRD